MPLTCLIINDDNKKRPATTALIVSIYSGCSPRPNYIISHSILTTGCLEFPMSEHVIYIDNVIYTYVNKLKETHHNSPRTLPRIIRLLPNSCRLSFAFEVLLERKKVLFLILENWTLRKYLRKAIEINILCKDLIGTRFSELFAACLYLYRTFSGAMAGGQRNHVDCRTSNSKTRPTYTSFRCPLIWSMNTCRQYWALTSVIFWSALCNIYHSDWEL